jgi:sensor histidine kinase YesM
MFILVIRAEAWTARSTAARRIGALALAVLAGALMYTAVRYGIRVLQDTIYNGALIWEALVGYFVRSLVTGGLLTAILYYSIRERDAARLLHRAHLSRVEVESQLAESRLNLLRAQIEPHFLFNSLASVKRLYERDRSLGRALLGNLAAYLRLASRSSQRREVPLGDEVALARSFLGIFQVRMGARLKVTIDVPREHDAALVPPLAVGTLVENAIKHGLAPRASGGRLSLRARREGDQLVVGIGDDGVGFRAYSGAGVGLANTRARLDTLFGDAGSLELAANPGGGVTATMRLPYRVSP